MHLDLNLDVIEARVKFLIGLLEKCRDQLENEAFKEDSFQEYKEKVEQIRKEESQRTESIDEVVQNYLQDNFHSYSEKNSKLNNVNWNNIISWIWHIKLFKHLNYFIFKGFGRYGKYNILSINPKEFWWLLTIKLMKSLKMKNIKLIWFLLKNSKFSLEFITM